MLNYVIPMELCYYYGCYYGITIFLRNSVNSKVIVS